MHKKYVILGIVIFAVLLAAADFFLGRPKEPENQAPAGAEKSNQNSSPETNFFPPIPASTKTRIIAPEEFKGPVIHYDGQSFSPAFLALSRDKDQNGCLVKIINDTDDTVVIRLGPYEPGKIRGFPYTPISPRSFGFFDLRYNVDGDLEFYNLNKSLANFVVRTQMSCR